MNKGNIIFCSILWVPCGSSDISPTNEIWINKKHKEQSVCWSCNQTLNTLSEYTIQNPKIKSEGLLLKEAMMLNLGQSFRIRYAKPGKNPTTTDGALLPCVAWHGTLAHVWYGKMLDRFCRYTRNWMNGLINEPKLKTPTFCWYRWYQTYHGMVRRIGPAPKIWMICRGAFDRRLFAIFWKIQDFVQICTLKSRTTKGFTKKTRNHSILPLTIVSARGISREPITTACHQT